MSDPSARTFTGDFKRFFLRGLVVLLPTVLTLWIIVQLYLFVDNRIAEPINRGVRVAMVNTAKVWAPLREIFDPTAEGNPKWKEALDANPGWGDVVTTGEVPQEMSALRSELRQANINQWWRDRWYMDLIGLFVAIIGVYIAGRLLGGFFGRRIYRKVEDLITTLPVFKQVYPYVKQIVDFLFSDDRPIKFNRVVACEYPRKGIWSVGFMTGSTLRSIQKRAGNSVTIFIPSSPTPFTGYTITVPRKDVIELPLTVEEAIRFAVSGGVLVPDHQTTPEEAEELAGEGIEKPADSPDGLRPLPGLVRGPPAAAGKPPTGSDPGQRDDILTLTRPEFPPRRPY